jgi:CUB domain
LQIVRIAINAIAISDSTGKVTDSLYIYDGDAVSDPLIIALSRRYWPPLPTYVSSQRFVLIRFVSDNSSAFGGFNLTFTASDG